MEEDIKILRELEKNANIENADMNDCFGGEHIEAIENVLKELETLKNEKEKSYLQGFKDSEDKYNTVIADNMKKDKVIDEMAIAMENNHCSIQDVVAETICDKKRCIGNSIECRDCIKQYFIKKVEEQE